MADKPTWRGVLIDRAFLKGTIKARFKRIAKGNVDEEIGGLVNDLERYLAGELLMNTREIIKGIRDELDGSLKFMEEYAEGIDETIIKRRAQQLEEPGGEDD